MGDAVVKLKTIADLQNEKARFFIDAYQRGYRWTENEVRDLLDDIREFSHLNTDDGKFYCLQPIIVTLADDGVSWKVIDGQQRLTTLYLIYSFYYVVNTFAREPMPFELSYNNKPKLQECIKAFADNEYATIEKVHQNMSDFEDDIDCHYVLEAYKCICNYFNKLRSDRNISRDITRMKDTFDSGIKIIWYELTNCSLNTEVSIFSKINMGKIALTNAELIKALLLKNDDVKNDDSNINPLAPIQMNIAVKWDEIEANLSEKEFWNFLVNEKSNDSSYATRIDFIFHVMARDLNDGILKDATIEYKAEEPYTVFEAVNKDKFSFYVFSNYVRLLQKHPEIIPNSNQHYIELIWDGVCEYYRMFKDWYKNILWYHMIGFLVSTSKNGYIDQIIKLGQIYREGSNDSGEGHKDHFDKKLRSLISMKLFGSENPTVSACRDFVTDLSYEQEKSKEHIRNVLVLYNIAYLDSCNKEGRFPFDKYKDETLSWDLEHINAVSDTRPDDDRNDSEENNRLQWLIRACEIPDIDKIKTSDGTPVLDLINTIRDNKYYLSKYQSNSKDFIQVYETVINYFGGSGDPDHSIGNLTLLDCGTNRSYKNDVFPLKRNTILNRTMSDVFIPLCTRRVFMKAFADSRDLLRWGDIDKAAYMDDIVKNISRFLHLKEEVEGEKHEQ